MSKMVNLAIVAGLFAGSVPLALGLDEGRLQEPRGGQPPMGSKPSVENIAEQVTYQHVALRDVDHGPAQGIGGA